MKKVCIVLLAFVLVLALGACGSGGSAAGDHVDGEISDLLAQVTEGATDPEMSLMESAVTDESFSWFFFIDPIDGAEGVVSEPVIGSIPHCVGLLRVPEGVDAEAVRADIEENVNPMKWVCVEAEKTAVLNRGDLILLVMSDADVVDKVTANFEALGK